MRFFKRFRDRGDAGRALASRLLEVTSPPTVVLGIPHGGIPVAAAIAEHLSAPMSAAWVRRLVAPHDPDVVFGAVDVDGDVTVCTETIRAEGLSDEMVAEIAYHAHERLQADWQASPGLDASALLGGATAIVVDDGLCTGLTLRAAMRWARRQGARQVVVAVPVVDDRIWPQVAVEADGAVSLHNMGDEPIARSDVFEDHRMISDEEAARFLAAGMPAGMSSTSPIRE